MTESRGTLVIDWEEFDRLTAKRGWHHDGDRARGLGLSYQALNHVRKGRHGPGVFFVACVLEAFGGKAYDRVFKRAEQPDPAKAVA